MRIGAILLMAFIGGVAVAADLPQDYSAAKDAWKKSKGKPEYQRYANEFLQFNNHYRLDEKDACYGLAPGPVNLYLIISKPDAGEFSVVERVFADVDNAKARCFIKTYRGVQTKTPPFLPFVFHMSMG
jgi:hypothetical protein